MNIMSTFRVPTYIGLAIALATAPKHVSAQSWQSQIQSASQACVIEGPENLGPRVTQGLLSLANGGKYSRDMSTGGRTFGLKYAYVTVIRGNIAIGFDNGQPGPRVQVADGDGDGIVDSQKTPFMDELSKFDAQLVYCTWGLFFLTRSSS